MATGKPTRRRSPLLPPLLPARAARATFRAESPLAMSLTRYRTRSPDPAVQTLFSGGGKAFNQVQVGAGCRSGGVAFLGPGTAVGSHPIP